MPTKTLNHGRPQAVPVELGGKWIAWNSEHTRVVAQAETLPQLWQSLQATQISDPVIEKVPLADVRFVGAR